MAERNTFNLRSTHSNSDFDRKEKIDQKMNIDITEIKLSNINYTCVDLQANRSGVKPSALSSRTLCWVGLVFYKYNEKKNLRKVSKHITLGG